jgi:transposase
MFLLAHGEWVVEVDRPKRAARRNGAKSDELDAIRAAREALERGHLAQPRARGDREAVRVLLITRRGAIRARTKAINHLKAG